MPTSSSAVGPATWTPSRIFTATNLRASSRSRGARGSPEEGEDLLQEIFLQAYRELESFKGHSSIGTWLYRLALNHCLDHVRGKRAG
jgi:DNA-directed RNA polymerase specialized sigma24 family protein